MNLMVSITEHILIEFCILVLLLNWIKLAHEIMLMMLTWMSQVVIFTMGDSMMHAVISTKECGSVGLSWSAESLISMDSLICLSQDKIVLILVIIIEIPEVIVFRELVKLLVVIVSIISPDSIIIIAVVIVVLVTKLTIIVIIVAVRV